MHVCVCVGRLFSGVSKPSPPRCCRERLGRRFHSPGCRLDGVVVPYSNELCASEADEVLGRVCCCCLSEEIPLSACSRLKGEI